MSMFVSNKVHTYRENIVSKITSLIRRLLLSGEKFLEEITFQKNNMDNVIVLYRFRMVAPSFLKYRN